MTAWVALIAWPFVSMIFFRVWALPLAVCATLIGGYLLLPTQIGLDLPILPRLDKHTIPALSALVLTMVAVRRAKLTETSVLAGWLPQSSVVRACLLILAVGALGTGLTNSQPIRFEDYVQPGLRFYDLLSIGLTILMSLIPFFLARKVLASLSGQKTLIATLVVAASGYAVLALWEVRMSPQLNNHIYGFFPHSWLQHIRGGGFRPLVFLEHGLWLGIFLATAIVAASAMTRQGSGSPRALYASAALWLTATLMLSKALGALLIVLVLLPVALLLSRRLQLLAAVAVATMTLTYPALRAADLAPTDWSVEVAKRIGPARAESLKFRLDNEDILLERARERPFFGWGGWGRNRVYNEQGRDLSITDGRWVILFGQGGWVRYIGEFGLLTWGILALFFRRRENIDPVSVALALALAANLVDLLPNAGMSPLTWMLAGALIGRLEYGVEKAARPETLQARSAAPTYRRSFADKPQTPAPDLVPEPAGLRTRRDRTRRSPATLKLRRGDN